jgi:hypothetical protein
MGQIFFDCADFALHVVLIISIAEAFTPGYRISMPGNLLLHPGLGKFAVGASIHEQLNSISQLTYVPESLLKGSGGWGPGLLAHNVEPAPAHAEQTS